MAPPSYAPFAYGKTGQLLAHHNPSPPGVAVVDHGQEALAMVPRGRAADARSVHKTPRFVASRADAPAASQVPVAVVVSTQRVDESCRSCWCPAGAWRWRVCCCARSAVLCATKRSPERPAVVHPRGLSRGGGHEERQGGQCQQGRQASHCFGAARSGVDEWLKKSNRGRRQAAQTMKRSGCDPNEIARRAQIGRVVALTPGSLPVRFCDDRRVLMNLIQGRWLRKWKCATTV